MVPELLIVPPALDKLIAATPTLPPVMVPVLVIVVPAPDTMPMVPEMAPELVIVVPAPDLIPSPLADEIVPELLIVLLEPCRNAPGAPVSDERVPKLLIILAEFRFKPGEPCTKPPVSTLMVKPFWLPVP